MSAEQETGPLHGPYGRNGDETGSDALLLLENLLAPKTVMPFGPDQTPRWDETDQRGFDYLVAVDEGMACQDPSFDVDGPATGDLIRIWQQFTAVLPFSEGERYWVLTASRQRTDGEFSKRIAKIEARITSAGIQQALSGRDLVRRWASWRRETDEFAGQHSLSRAQVLLNGMIRELVPTKYLELESLRGSSELFS